MNKLTSSAATAVTDISDGSSVAVGGFGLCGTPMELIREVHALGVSGLRVVSNNCGVQDWGLGILLADRRIARMTSSYVGENKEFARQYLNGELEVELVPQGTLAERLRAGGCGIPAFYTPAGVGTQIAQGGLPWSHDAGGAVVTASPERETRSFGDRPYVLEEAIVTDFALVHAAVGDRFGNLRFNASAQNFNPLCAMAGRVAVAQVEEVVDALEPGEVHLPGIFVQRVVHVGRTEKRIERTTVRPVPEGIF